MHRTVPESEIGPPLALGSSEYGDTKGTIEPPPQVANFGRMAVTERNHSVSNSTDLARDLNSQIPWRGVMM